MSPTARGKLHVRIGLLIVFFVVFQAVLTQASDFPFQDYQIQRGIEAIGSSPTRPNTPRDIALVEEYYRAQQQRDADALALFAGSATQFDQDLAYYQGVLRSGGDPRVFFGQSPLPDYGPNLFNDPFYTGPGYIPATPRVETGGFAGAQERYMATFLTDLDRLLDIPELQSPPLNLSPINPPESCSTGDPLLAGTIRFRHRGVSPVVVYVADSRCREIFHSILYPGFDYTAITFVGQTWRLRELTGQYVQGDYEIIIRTTGLTDNLITPATNQQNQLASEVGTLKAPGLAQSPTGQVPALVARFAAIRERQADQFYSDPALQALRAEQNQYFLTQIYADPLALYLTEEYDSRRENIRRASPAYAEAEHLATEIASWTSVPQDSALLQQRYAKRQRQQQLSADVEDYLAEYLAKNPAVDEHLNALSQQLAERLDTLRSMPEALIWQAAWQQRWDRAYFASERGFAETQEILDIQTRYPDFAEYLKLNNEIGAILPALADTAPVQKIAVLQDQVKDSASARARIRELDIRFAQQSAAIMASSGADIVLERFYEQVNALRVASPAYAMAEASNATIVQLEAFRAEVHAAVAACYANQGEDCDPTSDRAIQTLLRSDRLGILVSAAASSYGQQDSFWQQFYTSAAYLALENTAKSELAGPLGSAQPALDAARVAYEKDKAAIPELSALQAAEEEVYNELCRPDLSLASLPVNDPTVAICSRLTSMAALVPALDARRFQTTTLRAIHLPLVIR